MDRTLCVYGSSGNGKSTSLRNLVFERTGYINWEGKPLPFKGSRRLKYHFKPKNIAETKANIKTCVEDDEVDTIICDSITMFADNMVYPELVKTAVNERGEPDTRAGWMLYRDAIAAMLEYCKKSGKNFIFIALATDVYNNKEMVTKTVPAIQGSLKDKLASHFTYVYYATTIEENNGIRYVFQTNKTIENKNVEAKTPMGVHDEVYIDNDIVKIIEDIEKWDD